MKGIISISIALALLTAACGGGTSPNGSPTTGSQPSVAATNAPAPASPTAASTLGSASAAPSAIPPTVGTSTPAKAEEAKETNPSSVDEVSEGPPKPNPLPAVGPGGNKDFAAVPGANVTTNGAAASIHGSVPAGQVVFSQTCQACHGVEGKGGITNPNSDDGTVPPLNPIDPGFAANAKGDPAAFAREIDLFIQHGSRPPGPNPALSMPGWGDQNKLTQQQIADVEAYVMQLNSVTWPAR